MTGIPKGVSVTPVTVEVEAEWISSLGCWKPVVPEVRLEDDRRLPEVRPFDEPLGPSPMSYNLHLAAFELMREGNRTWFQLCYRGRL